MFSKVAFPLNGRVVIFKQAGNIDKQASQKGTYTEVKLARIQRLFSEEECSSASASLRFQHHRCPTELLVYFLRREQFLDFRPEGRHNCYQSCLDWRKGRKEAN